MLYKPPMCSAIIKHASVLRPELYHIVTSELETEVNNEASKFPDGTKLFRVSKVTGKSQSRVSRHQARRHSNCWQNEMLRNTKVQGQSKPNYNYTTMRSKLAVPQERAQGIVIEYSTLHSLMVRKQEILFKRNTAQKTCTEEPMLISLDATTHFLLYFTCRVKVCFSWLREHTCSWKKQSWSPKLSRPKHELRRGSRT